MWGKEPHAAGVSFRETFSRGPCGVFLSLPPSRVGLGRRWALVRGRFGG